MIEKLRSTLTRIDIEGNSLGGTAWERLRGDAAEAVRLELDCMQMHLSASQREKLHELSDLLEVSGTPVDTIVAATRGVRRALNMEVGRVEAIWSKRAHRGPMDPLPQVELIAGKGLAPSVDRSRRRQVTIIEKERWSGFEQALGVSLDPAGRRANLMVSGIQLPHTRGKLLGIGDVRIRIGGETTPCERMEEFHAGLQELMRVNWGGGVFGQVEAGGVIRVGDSVEWKEG